jgi:acetate kinase
MSESAIFVVNPGSSSLKFGIYSQALGNEKLLLSGSADRIGQSDGTLELRDADQRIVRTEKLFFKSEGDALVHLIQWLREFSKIKPSAIGHRIVHGGPHLTYHQLITPSLLIELKLCTHLAPLHTPVSLKLIEVIGRMYPMVAQYACFDTAFHTTLPESAARFAIPRELFAEGIRRYGFHGLSYESIVFQLGQELPERTVIAHLGSGASLVALKNGISVDTTMGLTPTGGIPMETRSGDLDPGVLLYLMRVKQMDVKALESMLIHQSGLKAVSDSDGDMRTLLDTADAGDLKAKLAIDIFCIAVRKVIAAYTAVLGGIDLLVFTGGIGEQSQRIRSMIGSGLGFLNLKERVFPSQEDVQIARHCREMMTKETKSLPS